jgi:pyruvate dehydrogenase E2 component (dihydrolipoamide acetyltransferase)
MPDAVEVLVPDIGDFTDVPVIEVLVAPGDTVAEEDPLVTLESDKATMDVPAPAAGVVVELRVKVGDTVSEGTPLLTLSPDGVAPEHAPAPEAAVVAEASAEPQAPPEPAPAAAPAAPSGNGASAGTPVYASPAVRRQARELGVDLSMVRGSGRKGRITKEDVQDAVRVPAPSPARPGADGAVALPGLELAPWPKVDFAKYGPIERVPLSRIKRISGPNLARNWVMIPHVTHHDEADITQLEAFRKQLNAEQSDVKVTMVALLLKACVASLQEFPDFNASLDGDDLVVKRYWNLGFAADTPLGLVVPVIRDVDKKGLLEIAAELRDLSAAAREGRLKPTDMSGGTFSISSLGGIGGTGFTPIVNAPEVAILGVTRSAMKPVWNGEEFVPRLMLPLSLSYDHRVVDGAAAARFCVHLSGVLMDLRRALL